MKESDIEYKVDVTRNSLIQYRMHVIVIDAKYTYHIALMSKFLSYKKRQTELISTKNGLFKGLLNTVSMRRKNSSFNSTSE